MALRLDFPAGLDHDETVASSNLTYGTRAAPPALTRQSPREPVPPACPRNRDTVIDRITPLLLTLAAGLVLVPFAVASDEAKNIKDEAQSDNSSAYPADPATTSYDSGTPTTTGSRGGSTATTRPVRP